MSLNTSSVSIQSKPMFGAKKSDNGGKPPIKVTIKTGDMKKAAGDVLEKLAEKPENIQIFKAIVESFDPETSVDQMKAQLEQKVGPKATQIVDVILAGDAASLQAEIFGVADKTDKVIQAVKDNFGEQTGAALEKALTKPFEAALMVAGSLPMVKMIMPQLLAKAKKNAQYLAKHTDTAAQEKQANLAAANEVTQTAAQKLQAFVDEVEKRYYPANEDPFAALFGMSQDELNALLNDLNKPADEDKDAE